MEGSLFLRSLLLAVCAELQLQDGCAWECEDGTCEIQGGKGSPKAGQAGNPLSSFTPHRDQLCWELGAAPKATAEPCAGEEGWAVRGLPPSAARCVLRRCLWMAAAGLCTAARVPQRVCLPCLRQPLCAGSTILAFTRRQTGGLDTLPAFCYRGHRLGSVPSFFSLCWSGILPRTTLCCSGDPPERVTPLPKHAEV